MTMLEEQNDDSQVYNNESLVHADESSIEINKDDEKEDFLHDFNKVMKQVKFDKNR